VKSKGVVQKAIIFVGLLAVIVLIALIAFRPQNNSSESSNPAKEKNETYAKVIEALGQSGKKTDGLSAIAACVDSRLFNGIDSDDGVPWKYILYDSSEDLSKEEMKSVCFAHVNASGKIKYIGQGRMMTSVLRSNISKTVYF